ncbi:ecdysone receptor-like isoform X2 [Paramacrobiotus metropolitanus]|uniref:ecdysone receptor-like isoform X2 n=1 Tax=Paramacrobiotus metropolitanus TaxID=2943436 RepID=UPI0024459FE6|nr:ecdysone receptor-like isoform X2 [Paramacrobiotus metropolitanus]
MDYTDSERQILDEFFCGLNGVSQSGLHVNGLGPPGGTVVNTVNQTIPQIPDTSNMSYGGLTYPPVCSTYSVGNLTQFTMNTPSQCLVCGDTKSLGKNYGGWTCTGCKSFFRRCIEKQTVPRCKYGGQCEIDLFMRRKCPECRLKKCFRIGMRMDLVARDDPNTPKNPDEGENVKPPDHRSPASSTSSPAPAVVTTAGSVSSPASVTHSACDASLASLPEHPHQQTIKIITYYQEIFDIPSTDDIQKLTNFAFTGDVQFDKQRGFEHFAELTILAVQLVVRFAKHLPGFDTLVLNDQLVLLKESSVEVLQLRTARRYDVSTDSILFSSNHAITRECYKSVMMSNCAHSIYNFCRHVVNQKVDNVEYALLTALVIFSPRPDLENLPAVLKWQEMYLDIFQDYVKMRRNSEPNALAKLLMILTKLRSLGSDFNEMLFSLKLENRKLPPLLEEIWISRPV